MRSPPSSDEIMLFTSDFIENQKEEEATPSDAIMLKAKCETRWNVVVDQIDRLALSRIDNVKKAIQNTTF